MSARLELEIDPSGLRAGASVADQELASVKASASAATAEMAKMNDEMASTGQQAARTGAAIDGMTGRVNASGAAHLAHSRNSRQATMATMEFDHVVRAMSDSLAAGIDPFQAMRMEMGRIVEAMSMAGGGASKFGAFMMGPWGIAIQLGTAILVPLIAEMFKADEAFGKLEIGASALSQAQGALGEMFDLTTGKLKRNTEALILNATAQAINLRASAAAKRDSSQQTFDEADQPSLGRRIAGNLAIIGAPFMGGSWGGAMDDLSGNADVMKLMDRVRAAGAMTDPIKRATAESQIMQEAYYTDFKGSRVDKKSFIQAIADAGTSSADSKAADEIMSSIKNGSLDPDLRNPARTKKAPKPKNQSPLEEFGLEAQHQIDDVFSKYDDTPTGVAAAQKQIEALDLLMKKLADRKPPGFKDMISEAEQAEQVIRNGISKPFDDFVKAQNDSFQVLQLEVAGRQDEADALKTVLSLQKTMGPLTDDQKEAVLDTVQAMRAEQRQLEINQERIKINTDALASIKGVVEDATQAWERGDLGQLIKSPGKILQAFQTMKGQQLFDNMFGGLFRDLKDQASGVNVVKDASTSMGAAMDQLTPKITRTSTAHVDMTQHVDAASVSLTKFTTALDTASSAVAGAGAAGQPTAANPNGANPNGQMASLLGDPAAIGSVSVLSLLTGSDGLGSSIKGLGDSVKDIAAEAGDVVVTGRRQKNQPLGGTDLFAKALGGVAESVAGLFTNGPNAKSFGEAFGKNAGKALGGAATGQMVSGISNALGVKMNSTGASIGGAIGSFIPIPGGSIIGSVLGGLVGNLFSHPKWGTASLTGNDTKAATGGNSASVTQGASSSASSVQTGLAQVASQLGAAVGSYSIAVGMFNGKYRVNDQATTRSLNFNNFNSSTLHDFGTDQTGALTYAISEAIKQGAITGLSATESRILSSESNSKGIDQAVADTKTFKDIQDAYAQMTDPLNYSLKQLNDQFTSLKQIMDANSATAAEYSNAEKVYQAQRQQIIDNGNDNALKAMKQYVLDLTGGTSSPLSPEQRYATTKAQLDQDDATRKAGGIVSFDDYKADADAFLAASRDAQGSSVEFFADLNRVTSTVNGLIDATTKAAVTTPVIDLSPVTTAVNNQTDKLADLLTQINGKMSAIGGITGSVGSAVTLAQQRYLGYN